ncbi:aminopeptidase B-like [Liolophura sinensis]|uniref:aminopeptidase B-like n=1 Tax=Liolophura sinensis TaxID=3198878 RepID=UPI003158E53E
MSQMCPMIHGDKATDGATCSNFRDVRIKKYELDLVVNFEKREIQSECTLRCEALSSVSEVFLDCHETMKITGIENGESKVIPFSVQPFRHYGSMLAIQLASELSAGTEFTLKIQYIATGGRGVEWLNPAQTAGKMKPYLYTQGQAVMNRSFFPCQDTPAVKAPYSASVQVPEGFTAVMSANSSSEKHGRYLFEQSVPIQSYLVALAVGDLVSAEIGPRSRVWTEPSLLKSAKEEFGGIVENFLTTGEELFGPYVWGRYDILVMPPSFPFGGMENPCLTFVTPCLLVGDKSMTDVVIHEIAHSWFGNLVTNANWSEFWLNEGFTMFAQRRIMQKLYGAPYTCLETLTGKDLLRRHMDDTGEDHMFNRLRVLIDPDMDPDDTYNETPYEKGFMFVSYLQNLVGDLRTFDDFLKAYINKFKYKSIVAEDMLEYFLDYFPELKEKDVQNRPGYEFDRWLHTPGWPPYEPDLSASREFTAPADELAKQWISCSGQPPSTDVSGWRAEQLIYFLDRLLEAESLPEDTLRLFVSQYPQIVNSHNAEIRLRWAQIVAKNDFSCEFDKITSFLECQGKLKYTLPVYKALVKGTDKTRELAIQIFNHTRDQLHVEVRQRVQKILDQQN